jgi:hypothetical protein
MFRLTEFTFSGRNSRASNIPFAGAILSILLLGACATAPEPVSPAPVAAPPPPVVTQPAEPEPEPPPPEPVAKPITREVEMPEPKPDPASVAAHDLVLILSGQLGMPVDAVTIVEAVETVWPNACLGFPAEGEICAEVLTPGFAVNLEADSQRYSYRTDETMERIRLVAAPIPDIGTPLAVWKDTRSSFATATVGSRGFALGLRGGPHLAVSGESTSREAMMGHLLARFAPFQAVTEAGEIDFRGEGTEEAGEIEQRMVAEWVRGYYLSIWINGNPDIPTTVLTWERTGGLAGFCDIVAVNAGGEVVVSDCRAGDDRILARSWLDRRQLTEVFGWLDELESFESTQTESAKAGALSISITLRANGWKKVDPEVLAAIHRLASDLYLQSYEASNGPQDSL